MITFSLLQSPDERFFEIPANKGDKTVYVMYLNNSPVGDTYGSSDGNLVISLHGQGTHFFYVSDIARVQYQDLSLKELFNLGRIIH